MRFLQPVQVKALLEDGSRRGSTLILDVRDEDFAGGHIRGCVNIPSYELIKAEEVDKFLDGIDPVIDTLIVHCYLSQQRGPSCARR